MDNENCWWTVDDVSRYLQVSNDTIYRWIEKKQMPAKRIGKKWLFKKEEIEEKKLSIVTIIVEAIATSIDALCIGFVYLNRTIPDAMFIFSMIGLTTFVTSSIMGLLGSKIGKYLAKYSDLVAAIIFIALAIKTLLDGIL